MYKTFYYIIYLLAVILLLPGCSKTKADISEEEIQSQLKPIRYIGSYGRDFNDINELHLASALAIGIPVLKNREEVTKHSGKLIHIQGGTNCDIDELTHSVPYLVPEAAFLLYKIGQNFADSLQSVNAPKYKPIVTSITRTLEDVKKLTKQNINASENSAHSYGTTFDISWMRFNKCEESSVDLNEIQLKMVLANVLRDLQKEGKCYIKHERKQACFHITAR
ncbi:DUF5715 family protein [Bacteroidales bacterium OttesenSCG-928-M11]|nr:DUF5715 family protein [Bacteroidales bacterium OttesenSCG-928-M11]